MTAITLLTRGKITPGYKRAITATTWGILFFRNPPIVIPVDYVPLFVVGPQPPSRIQPIGVRAVVNGGIRPNLLTKRELELNGERDAPFIEAKTPPLNQVHAPTFIEKPSVEFIEEKAPEFIDPEDTLKLIPQVDPEFIDNDN